jgi:hypothetical protein
MRYLLRFILLVGDNDTTMQRFRREEPVEDWLELNTSRMNHGFNA